MAGGHSLLAKLATPRREISRSLGLSVSTIVTASILLFCGAH